MTPRAAPGDDFPFYDGRPVALSAARWWGLMGAVLLGFLALALAPESAQSGPGALLRAGLFPLIPLLALRAWTGPHWRALFRPLRGRHVAIAVGIALLNLVVTLSVGLVVKTLFGANDNPSGQMLLDADTAGRLLFFARTLPQLLGEEVMTILPFLALLTWLSRRGQGARRPALIGAWLLSALPFALAHLPTYDWNFAQCLLIIGSARLVLTLAYLWTRNLWASTLAHVLNDWAIFGVVLLVGATPP